jgi:hypothetical protein
MESDSEGESDLPKKDNMELNDRMGMINLKLSSPLSHQIIKSPPRIGFHELNRSLQEASLRRVNDKTKAIDERFPFGSQLIRDPFSASTRMDLHSTMSTTPVERASQSLKPKHVTKDRFVITPIVDGSTDEVVRL